MAEPVPVKTEHERLKDPPSRPLTPPPPPLAALRTPMAPCDTCSSVNGCSVPFTHLNASTARTGSGWLSGPAPRVPVDA